MTSQVSALVQKVWNYAHVLKDDGLAFMDYTEQITYLLFLKMVSEQREVQADIIPDRYGWQALKAIQDDQKLAERYQQALRNFSEQPGLLGLIFTKPQSKINDPAKLRLLIQMIDNDDWASMDIDVKGAVYEGLLARNADDVRGGAGQYFTPRPVIRAVVQVMRPSPTETISDPACGTGGFLLAAYEYMRPRATSPQHLASLRTKALHGNDIVPNVARLCAMNLFLHGIGTDARRPAISIGDSLAKKPKPVDMVLTNPPFGKKSSITIFGEDRKKHTEAIYYERDEFWATTSNKQLNFVQHIYSMLKKNGRAAVVVPDNVLFESGAGEKIRRELLKRCDIHTILRLPTGIWYSTGVKANVIFFEKKAEKEISTQDVWVYDLRTQLSFSLHQNPITDDDLTDFISCYNPANRAKRKESLRFRRFSYEEIVKRPQANLDITWAAEALAKSAQRTPKAIMRGILSELGHAIKEFAAAEKQIRK